MIRFFRSARQKLLRENRLTRYMIYAIGEIVLVVIGILIALQINNWNEGRKARTEEQKILIQLKSEFESNLEQLDEKILMRNKMTWASKGLLNYIDHPEEFVQDSLLDYMFRLTQDPTFDPIENDLAVSGKLRIIQSDSLKTLLSSWASDAYQVQEMELGWQKIRSEVVLPIFVEKDFARNTIAYLLNRGYTPDHAFDKSNPLSYHIEPSDADLKSALIESQVELQGAASTCILFNKLINGQADALRTRIQTILSLIEKEMKSEQ